MKSPKEESRHEIELAWQIKRRAERLHEEHKKARIAKYERERMKKLSQEKRKSARRRSESRERRIRSDRVALARHRALPDTVPISVHKQAVSALLSILSNIADAPSQAQSPEHEDTTRRGGRSSRDTERGSSSNVRPHSGDQRNPLPSTSGTQGSVGASDRGTQRREGSYDRYRNVNPPRDNTRRPSTHSPEPRRSQRREYSPDRDHEQDHRRSRGDSRISDTRRTRIRSHSRDRYRCHLCSSRRPDCGCCHRCGTRHGCYCHIDRCRRCGNRHRGRCPVRQDSPPTHRHQTENRQSPLVQENDRRNTIAPSTVTRPDNWDQHGNIRGPIFGPIYPMEYYGPWPGPMHPQPILIPDCNAMRWSQGPGPRLPYSVSQPRPRLPYPVPQPRPSRFGVPRGPQGPRFFYRRPY